MWFVFWVLRLSNPLRWMVRFTQHFFVAWHIREEFSHILVFCMGRWIQLYLRMRRLCLVIVFLLFFKIFQGFTRIIRFIVKFSATAIFHILISLIVVFFIGEAVMIFLLILPIIYMTSWFVSFPWTRHLFYFFFNLISVLDWIFNLHFF